MLLYSLEAASRLCSVTERSSTVEPSGRVASWCCCRPCAKLSTCATERGWRKRGRGSGQVGWGSVRLRKPAAAVAAPGTSSAHPPSSTNSNTSPSSPSTSNYAPLPPVVPVPCNPPQPQERKQLPIHGCLNTATASGAHLCCLQDALEVDLLQEWEQRQPGAALIFVKRGQHARALRPRRR